MNKKTLIILAAALIFLPSLFNFFSADDWFHLYLAQINNFTEFLNFFSFVPNAQSAAFYRPLPTQFFFYIFHTFFGLNSIPYYFFVLVAFSLSLFLVHYLTRLITKSTWQSLVVTFLYGFSVTNFSRIYFLSAFQEILLTIFFLLTIIKFLEGKRTQSLTFFVLALMSKETAVIAPLLCLAFMLLKFTKQKFHQLLPFLFILLFYLVLRLSVFGIAQGDTYVWDFSPKTALNTLLWYTLWSFGAPELFVDYVSGGFQIIPRFFSDYPTFSYVVIIGLLLSILTYFINFIKNRSNANRVFILAVVWFISTLLPVIFLPQHKFALELGLPLFGFSLLLSQSLKPNILGYSALLIYLIFNLSMNYLTYTRHYSTRRGVLSERVYDYLIKNHYPCPPNKDFLFYNSSKENYSQEIKHTISDGNMIKVVCQNKETNTFFDDQIDSSKVSIPAEIFFPI